MQEAGFSTVFKTLIWIIAIYYIVKFLARLFLPILAKKVVEKAGKKFEEQQQYYKKQQENPAGNNTKSGKPREKKKVGEYIDYEEL
jgi:hypothetical protein